MEEKKWSISGFFDKMQNPKVKLNLKFKEAKKTLMKCKANQVGHATE